MLKLEHTTRYRIRHPRRHPHPRTRRTERGDKYLPVSLASQKPPRPGEKELAELRGQPHPRRRRQCAGGDVGGRRPERLTPTDAEIDCCRCCPGAR